MKDYSPIEKHECGEECERSVEDLVCTDSWHCGGNYGKSSK